jgi:hypothetical protein
MRTLRVDLVPWAAGAEIPNQYLERGGCQLFTYMLRYILRRYVGFNPLTLIRQTIQMRRYARSYRPGAKSAKPSAHFAVVVMPWLGTTVPWFSIVIGMILAAEGIKVTFVVDGMPFGDYRLRFRSILFCIRRVLASFAGRFEVLEIAASRKEGGLRGALDSALVQRLAELNTVWAMRGEMKRQGRSRYTERITEQLERSTGAIQSFVASRQFDCIIVSGGISGSSGIWRHWARSKGIRLASFDSGGRGIVTVATNGIASQLHDIPRAFALLKAQLRSEQDRLFVRDAALAELRRRRAGTDRFSSQLPATDAIDARFNGAVLLALNSAWDSAALGLHEVFDSTTKWIIETVRYLLESTTARIVLRQHPGERFDAGHSSEDYRGLLLDNFDNNPRIIFIAATDPVNSYDLLDLVSVVLVYTSTIGIEAALKGKVVITPSSSYYSRLGFVWQATSRAQYNDQLVNAVAGRYTVSEQMKADALTCYYLTQCCNWISSPLSPEGYDDWIQMPFENLTKQDGVRITSTALRDDVPASYLIHMARVRDAQRLAAK